MLNGIGSSSDKGYKTMLQLDSNSLLHKLAILSVLAVFATIGFGRISYRPAPLDSKTFIQSVKEGRYDEVKRFLDSGMNPNQRDENYRTALYVAEATGRVNIKELLLSYGADQNAKDRSGLEKRTGISISPGMQSYLEAIDRDRVLESM